MAAKRQTVPDFVCLRPTLSDSTDSGVVGSMSAMTVHVEHGARHRHGETKLDPDGTVRFDRSRGTRSCKDPSQPTSTAKSGYSGSCARGRTNSGDAGPDGDRRTGSLQAEPSRIGERRAGDRTRGCEIAVAEPPVTVAQPCPTHFAHGQHHVGAWPLTGDQQHRASLSQPPGEDSQTGRGKTAERWGDDHVQAVGEDRKYVQCVSARVRYDDQTVEVHTHLGGGGQAEARRIPTTAVHAPCGADSNDNSKLVAPDREARTLTTPPGAVHAREARQRAGPGRRAPRPPASYRPVAEHRRRPSVHPNVAGGRRRSGHDWRHRTQVRG